MSEEKSLKSPSRRAFFTKAGAGVGAAGVVAVVGLSDKSAQAGVKSENDFKKSAYRETEHVKRYYDLARL